MRKSLLLSSAALLALAGAAKADDLLPETVVVTATRIPTPLDQIGSSVTLITEAEIDNRQQRTLPDVLQTVPGLNIVQTGGPGGQTSVFMRGTESRHTKVLVDGIDIADPASPNDAADLGKIFTGDIARVEVLRGPQSGVYGSDAVGGVINVITQAGEGAPRFTAQAEGGSFDTFNQRAGVSGSEGDFHYALSLDHVHAGATPVTPLNLLPPGQKRNDDYYDGLTGSARLGLDVTDNFDLGLVTRYVDSVARVTNDAFLSVPPYSSAPSAFQTRLGTLQYQTRASAHLSLWEGRFDQTLGFAYNSTVSRSLDPDNGNALGTGHRTKLDWQGDIKLGEGETLVLGAESERERLRVAQASGFTYNLKAGTTTNAGYAELQSVLGDFSNSLNLRYDDNSRFGSKLTYRVAPTYTIAATGTRLKASIGSAFKPPSLEQLYGPYSHNALLKPETSTGYDAGFEQDLGPVTAGVTWFRNDIKNLIAYGPAPAFALANIGRAMTQGVESFAAWKVGDSLSLRADYTYTDATDEVLHQELARRPRNKASLTADWQATPELMLDATLVVTGPQIDGNRDFSIPRLTMPGYAVLNLAASYRLTEGFTLFGRVENATDTQYQSPDGFLRPRLGAFAGVKAAF
jgi:vitamin B12 transporter